MNSYENEDKIIIDVARLDHIWRDGPDGLPRAGVAPVDD